MERDRASRDDLPLGWKRARDAATGRTYYYNRAARASSWTRPRDDDDEAATTATKRETSDGSDGRESDDADDADAVTRARRLMEAYEARCADVGARGGGDADGGASIRRVDGRGDGTTTAT